jgi:hypothetical protein
MARARNTEATSSGGEFTCPECGKTFGRAAALGAHRSRAHGVAGATASRRARPKRTTTGAKRTAAARTAASTPKRAPATSAGAGAKTTTTRKRATTARRAGGTRTAGGAARSAGTRGSGRRTQATVNRDALLQALFPSGIPARESVLSQVNSWLAEADRLAKLA